jgi:hypothetical protein
MPTKMYVVAAAASAFPMGAIRPHSANGSIESQSSKQRVTWRDMVGGMGEWKRRWLSARKRFKSRKSSSSFMWMCGCSCPAACSAAKSQRNLQCTQCHAVGGHWALDGVGGRAVCVHPGAPPAEEGDGYRRRAEQCTNLHRWQRGGTRGGEHSKEGPGMVSSARTCTGGREEGPGVVSTVRRDQGW